MPIHFLKATPTTDGWMAIAEHASLQNIRLDQFRVISHRISNVLIIKASYDCLVGRRSCTCPVLMPFANDREGAHARAWLNECNHDCAAGHTGRCKEADGRCELVRLDHIC